MQFVCRAIDGNKSRLSLRVGYQMPANLDMYVGPAGVWGDVNDILQSGLHVMKVWAKAHITMRISLSTETFSTEEPYFSDNVALGTTMSNDSLRVYLVCCLWQTCIQKLRHLRIPIPLCGLLQEQVEAGTALLLFPVNLDVQ